jgi:hypothetical protein
MNFFLSNKLINGLTETENFQTFGKSMTTLIRIATGAGNFSIKITKILQLLMKFLIIVRLE